MFLLGIGIKVLLSMEILIHYCYGQIPTNQPIIDHNKIFLEDLSSVSKEF